MSTMCLPYHAHIESDMYQEDRKLDIPGPFSQLPWTEVHFFLHPQRVEDFTSRSGCYIWEMTSTGWTMMRHYHRLSFSKEISPKCNEFRSKLLLFCRNICKQHINRIQIGCGVLPCVVQASFLNQFERVHSQIDVRAFALRRKESLWSRLAYHNGLIWLLEICCWILIFFCTPCHVWVYVCFSLCLMITYECIIFFFKCNTYTYIFCIYTFYFLWIDVRAFGVRVFTRVMDGMLEGALPVRFLGSYPPWN